MVIGSEMADTLLRMSLLARLAALGLVFVVLGVACTSAQPEAVETKEFEPEAITDAIPPAQLDSPRCQYLRAPRSDSVGELPPKSVDETRFVPCEWTEALSSIMVPENWEPPSAGPALGGVNSSVSGLAFSVQDDDGIRLVQAFAVQVGEDLRGQEVSLRAGAIFDTFFIGEVENTFQREGVHITANIVTGAVDGSAQGFDEGDAVGIAMGFSDGYQLFIFTAISRAADAKRVEDLVFAMAESIQPHYSRQ